MRCPGVGCSDQAYGCLADNPNSFDSRIHVNFSHFSTFLFLGLSPFFLHSSLLPSKQLSPNYFLSCWSQFCCIWDPDLLFMMPLPLSNMSLLQYSWIWLLTHCWELVSVNSICDDHFCCAVVDEVLSNWCSTLLAEFGVTLPKLPFFYSELSQLILLQWSSGFARVTHWSPGVRCGLHFCRFSSPTPSPFSSFNGFSARNQHPSFVCTSQISWSIFQSHMLILPN